eukprot:3999240-Pleurochrysis_carterae.AAC.3
MCLIIVDLYLRQAQTDSMLANRSEKLSDKTSTSRAQMRKRPHEVVSSKQSQSEIDIGRTIRAQFSARWCE